MKFVDDDDDDELHYTDPYKPVTGHFAYKTLRLVDSLPIVW